MLVKLPFEFSLQRVLHITENEKKQLESEYQSIYRIFEKLAHDLFLLMKKKEDIETSLQEKLKATLSVDMIQMQLTYVKKLEDMIDEQKQQYQQTKIRLEKFQLILREKTIQVKKYEKLKSHALIEYKKDEKKKDMKLMDETASMNFIKH